MCIAKSFLRLIAALLAFCLLADPSFAAAISHHQWIVGQKEISAQHTVFDTEAIPAGLIQAFTAVTFRAAWLRRSENQKRTRAFIKYRVSDAYANDQNPIPAPKPIARTDQTRPQTNKEAPSPGDIAFKQAMKGPLKDFLDSIYLKMSVSRDDSVETTRSIDKNGWDLLVIPKDVIAEHAAALPQFLALIALREYLHQWGLSEEGLEQLGLPLDSSDRLAAFDLATILNYADAYHVLIPFFKNPEFIHAWLANGFTLTGPKSVPTIAEDLVNEAVQVQRRLHAKTIDATRSIQPGDKALLQVLNRMTIQRLKSDEEKIYGAKPPHKLVKAQRVALRYSQRLAKTGLTPYERKLLEFLASQGQAIAIRWHIEDYGGRAHPADNPYVEFGKPQATERLGLYIQFNSFMHRDSRNTFEIGKHETGHQIDAVNGVPGYERDEKQDHTGSKSEDQTGKPEHQGLYHEFRANLWALDNDVPMAFAATCIAYPLREWIRHFHIEAATPAQVYRILETLSQEFDREIEGSDRDKAQEIIDQILNETKTHPVDVAAHPSNGGRFISLKRPDEASNSPKNTPNESGRVIVPITEAHKLILESIQNTSERYLRFLLSRRISNRDEAIKIITQYWTDIQNLGLFSLPVPLQQALIDNFAKQANEVLENYNLLTYHDAAENNMSMTLFSIVEKRALDSPQGSWAFGVRRIWGSRQNPQQAFNSHLDRHIIYDLDAIDAYLDPHLTALSKSSTLANPLTEKPELKVFKDWFFTVPFVRMERHELKEYYIAFVIAHEYAHLQRQIAVPAVGVEHEELLAELFTMATSSPLMAFAWLIHWADRGNLRGVLFLSTIFGSEKGAEWMKQLSERAAKLYKNPTEVEPLEKELSQLAISLIHQIEDQLPGGRVLRPELPFSTGMKQIISPFNHDLSAAA